MKMKKRLGRHSRKLHSGFTLIELLVAMTMAIFLIGGILLMHQSGSITFRDANKMSRVQENVRFASDYMIRDIRNAGFRDETFLRFGHEEEIVNGYAQIHAAYDAGDPWPSLTIRYAGRGTCTEAFTEYRLVENRNPVNAAGELVCSGRFVPRDAPGNDTVTDEDWDAPIALVSGVNGIDFQPICPADDAGCACNTAASTCIGISVGLQFEGLRAATGTQDFEPRSIELNAAFRNIILDRMNASAYPSEEES